MSTFMLNVTTFPTIFFTFFLLLSVIFWLVAIFGFVGLDAIDIDIPEPDADVGDINLFAGILSKFGLNAVPLTIIISIVSLIGWLLCYYVSYFLILPLNSGWLKLLIGSPVLVVTLYISTLITAQIIKPLRKILNTDVTTSKTVIGQVLVVRTSRVDDSFGEATLSDGGAGLVLKVRATENEKFKTGDHVVAIEYLEDKNAYRVISKDEFLGNA
ncbi:MAG: DUF1449 family protein [Reinekea sp.]|nr:DUF1449 family protein [Reinekea sp.]